MERRAPYSMEGRKLAFTPANELAAELRMQLRLTETYALELRKQIRGLISPEVKPNSSYRDWEAVAESLSNKHGDTFTPKMV